jgi:hypothetical protein
MLDDAVLYQSAARVCCTQAKELACLGHCQLVKQRLPIIHQLRTVRSLGLNQNQ